jgi:FMN-dependent NADH-azoreductase
MKLLHIDSSILGDNSISRKLTQTAANQWRQVYPDIDIIYRDLAAQAPNHLSAEVLNAGFVQPEQRSALQRDEVALGEALLEEFIASDVVVIGAPMYNFTIPSQLKAWLDRVLVKGRTFKYTESGPAGLAGGKRVVIVSSRGGIYSAGSPAQAMDHQESYLKAALGFIGITDIAVIRAEGVNASNNRDYALASAYSQIRTLVRAAA